MHWELSSRYERHVLASFDKQLYLSDLVGDLDWRFEMKSGLLSFGDQFHWQAQILGTESEESGTWLWAWANQASGIPAGLLQAAHFMRELGEQHQIPELAEAQLPLGEINGHFLSMLASGECQAAAYYRGPYTGGAAFLLIRDERFERRIEDPLLRILSVFPQALEAVEIQNHKNALVGYLHYYGLMSQSAGNTILVKEGERTVLTASFDEQNRLMNLEGTVGTRDIRG
jgi:hypothetical protein